MFSQVRTVVKQVAESVLSVGGIRVGTEEPQHTSRPLIDGVEIRRYGPRIAAETTITAQEEAARNAGFRLLAGYIFGRNHQDRRIAMTAPVAQSPGGKDSWIIRFYMPATSTMDSLPAPDDERIRIVTMPAESVAVLRFSGDRGTAAIAARVEHLLETLRATGFEPVGKPATWLYDPPWTIAFRRRNEVVVSINE